MSSTNQSRRALSSPPSSAVAVDFRRLPGVPLSPTAIAEVEADVKKMKKTIAGIESSGGVAEVSIETMVEVEPEVEKTKKTMTGIESSGSVAEVSIEAMVEVEADVEEMKKTIAGIESSAGVAEGPPPRSAITVI